MLKRKAYNELLNWKKNHDRECLMVVGARQVGKTYLINEFGTKEYKSYLKINFIENPEYKAIFNGDLSADIIYKKLSLYFPNLKLIKKNTLFFLDEIQACGNARTALKFLAIDNQYDFIASGSLLGLTYGEDDDSNVEIPSSVPTGYESFLTLYSLDFEEYLWAYGYDDDRIDIIKDYYNNNTNPSSGINELFESLFREYIVVGGMPEVVNDFMKNKDFNKAYQIQNKIISDYNFDIAKHAKGIEKIKVKQCYDSIPSQLAKELKKFQYSFVEKGKTSKYFNNSITWLVDSGLVHICKNVSEPYIPLMANIKEEQFKLYVNDTGLLTAMYGYDTKIAIIENTIKGNAKGGIYENIIAESLIKKGHKLYYYKPNSENEIEFLIEKNGDVVPVEVKAGNRATPSLNKFIDEYKPETAYKLIDGSLGIVDCKKSIPHYMVIFI